MVVGRKMSECVSVCMRVCRCARSMFNPCARSVTVFSLRRWPTCLEDIRDVEAEPVVATGMVADMLTIQKHGGLPVHSPEMQQPSSSTLCQVTIEHQSVPHSFRVCKTGRGRHARQTSFHREGHHDRLVQTAPKRGRLKCLRCRLPFPQSVERSPKATYALVPKLLEAVGGTTSVRAHKLWPRPLGKRFRGGVDAQAPRCRNV